MPDSTRLGLGLARRRQCWTELNKVGCEVHKCPARCNSQGKIPARMRARADHEAADDRPGIGAAGRLQFARCDRFRRALRDNVTAHFRERGIAPSGDPRLHRKVALLAVWFVASYLALLLLAQTWWQAVPLALSVGLAATGLGFNVHHDANHGAFARTFRNNRALGFILDFLGGSSYVWRWKHNHFHHTFTNIAGHDADINGAPLVRMSTAQRRRAVHRFQHIYCWYLYTLFPLRWWFWDDYNEIARGRIEGHAFPRPRGWEALGAAAGKLTFLIWAVALPLWLRPAAAVAGCYLVASSVLGICLALSAQLSHCVEQTAPHAAGDRIDREWAVYQMGACAGFSHGSRLAYWFWGGLNYQVEHHLFPRISHVHYPAIAPIIEATCRQFGLPYHQNRTLWAALASHARLMRRLGRA